MIIISEYTVNLKQSAGISYLKKMEDAAKLIGIKIINFKQGNLDSLDAALYYEKDLREGEIVFWLGFVPEYTFYEKVHSLLKERKLQLIHKPSEFAKSEYFDQFYKDIKKYSIPSAVTEDLEEAKSIAQNLGYPIFLKGTIQSLKKLGWDHCIAKNEKELVAIFEKIKSYHDFSLGKVILRKFIELKHFEVGGNGIPKANEYRFFILNNKIIDFSFYWNGESPFSLKSNALNEMKIIALKTASLIKASFISLDIAETKNEGWKVIEIGDGQFSDIRKISPLKFWNSILLDEVG